MIRLSKTDEPDVLKKNGKRWTEELLAAVASNDQSEIARKTKRYNHPEIKSALKTETKEKCAYCEARITVVAHGDIEHVTPKSVDRGLTFSWANLTFACQICNQKKSAKENILDPYKEVPGEHLFFAGPFVKGRTLRGIETVHELDLNRVALIESRNRQIERYACEIEKVYLVSDEKIRRLILDSLLADLSSGKPEHIAACIAILESQAKAES